MAVTSMHELLIEELRELLDAEKQAGRAYPKLMKQVSSDALREALQEHNEETKGQVERLNQIFETMDMRTRGKACEALRGLVEDAQDFVERDLSPELLDVALLAAAQKMEHFEIAAYGAAQAHAAALGLEEVAQLLEETLDEEKRMDQRLNELALDEINPAAIEAEEGAGEDEEEEESGGRTRATRAAAGNKPRQKNGGRSRK